MCENVAALLLHLNLQTIVYTNQNKINTFDAAKLFRQHSLAPRGHTEMAVTWHHVCKTEARACKEAPIGKQQLLVVMEEVLDFVCCVCLR